MTWPSGASALTRLHAFAGHGHSHLASLGAPAARLSTPYTAHTFIPPARRTSGGGHELYNPIRSRNELAATCLRSCPGGRACGARRSCSRGGSALSRCYLRTGAITRRPAPGPGRVSACRRVLPGGRRVRAREQSVPRRRGITEQGHRAPAVGPAGPGENAAAPGPERVSQRPLSSKDLKRNLDRPAQAVADGVAVGLPRTTRGRPCSRVGGRPLYSGVAARSRAPLECLWRVCAVTRRCFPAGANPARRNAPA